MFVAGQVFFPGGLGVHPGSGNFACPPTDHRPHFSSRACPPQLSFVPGNFKYLRFQFVLMFSSKLHQKAVFYAWNTKTWAILASGDNFSKSPSYDLTPTPTWVPPSDAVPNEDRKIVLESKSPPPKILWKNHGGVLNVFNFSFHKEVLAWCTIILCLMCVCIACFLTYSTLSTASWMIQFQSTTLPALWHPRILINFSMRTLY